jgi:hypothetical protein
VRQVRVGRRPVLDPVQPGPPVLNRPVVHVSRPSHELEGEPHQCCH